MHDIFRHLHYHFSLIQLQVHFAEGSPITEQSPTAFGEQSTEGQCKQRYSYVFQ